MDRAPPRQRIMDSALLRWENTPWNIDLLPLRQPINDDKWHTLTVTHDAGKQEMRMYYDQLNVAIYCTNGNVNLIPTIHLE